METYHLLCKKVEGLPECVKKYIYSKDIGNKKIFLVKDNCPNLRPENRIHYKRRISEEYGEKINHLIMEDSEARNLLFSNLQDYFMRINQNSKLADKEDYNLFFIKEFGLVCVEYGDSRKACHLLQMRDLADDESISNEYVEVSKALFKDIMHLSNKRIIEQDALKKLILPFIRILEILNLKKDEHFFTDEKTYVVIKSGYLTSKEGSDLQNFFSSWLYHHFFEDYCNNLIGKEFKKEVIRNPKIFINPLWDGETKRIDGYLELDGSLVIEDDVLYISESKNSFKLRRDHFIILTGKCKILETIYQIEVKCLLISTGLRHKILKDIETYPNIEKFIIIKDRIDYKRGIKLT